jgi:D-glycero-D-manno-heptose 1,7-bisphosphate phosphatase
MSSGGSGARPIEAAALRRAVFLDTEGTLIDNVWRDADPRLAKLARGAGGALRMLKAHGYLIAVVSNQPGVALGRFPLGALAGFEQRLQQLLAPNDVGVDAFYYCPHLPQAANVRFAVRCLCRKPQPGLLRQAARDRRIDLSQSWVVGDTLDDVEAGGRAGCRTVLVDTGNETEWRLSQYRQPHYLAGSLRHAVQLILNPAGRPSRDPEDDLDSADVVHRA